MTSLQNLFVAKLPRNLTDSDLEQIFAMYAPESAKIMLDATTGKSKGFGFVLFDSVEKGEKAYLALNKTHVTLHGHSFNLAIFPSKHDGKVANEVSQCLYIRNLPKELSQADVEEFLRNFGNLTYCAMRQDQHGSPVWVVYAEYESVEDAKNALTKLHGSRNFFEDSPVAILAKYADSEEAKRERRKRREQQHQQQQQQRDPQGMPTAAAHAKGSHSNGDKSASPNPPPNPMGTNPNGGAAPANHPPHNHNLQHHPPMHHHRGFHNHFYTGTSASPGFGVPRVLSHGSSAPDLYMPYAADATASEGASNGGGSEDMAPPATPPLQQPTTPLGGFGPRPAGSFISAPTHRFAPTHRAARPNNAPGGLSAPPNGSFDSSNVGAFAAHAGTTMMLAPQHPSAAGGYGDQQMHNNLSPQDTVPPHQGGGLGSPMNNPTSLSQSFLGVSFPANTAQYEPCSVDPVTSLSFHFDTDMDQQQSMGSYLAKGSPAGPPAGPYADRTPVRVGSTLSGKSVTAASSTAGTRYRHNPYAAITPISSAPSSAGPSTPLIAGNSPHTAGPAAGVSAFSGTTGYPQQQQQYGSYAGPQQGVSVTMHFGHAHSSSMGGSGSPSHFANAASSNEYLGVPDGRSYQQ